MERVQLDEGRGLSAFESEAYVHNPPKFSVDLTPSSMLLCYWKPTCIAALTLSICYALVTSRHAPSQSEISLASIAEVTDDELSAAGLSEGEGEVAQVIYTGSEYQARMEQEKQVPAVVEDPRSSSQIINSPQRYGFVNNDVFVPRGRIEDLKSMVKFISGLIAVHRPNITDCGQVAAAIVRISAKEKVDPFLIAAIISVESRFGQAERSRVGAVGLMQLMPATARHVADPEQNVKPTLTDITTNIQLGIEYWKQLSKRYKGNNFLALAAYNWGPGNVDRNHRDVKRIPSGVSNYAQTIIGRHKSWVNHYQSAKASASKIG